MHTVTQSVRLDKIIDYWIDLYKAKGEGKIIRTSWGINPITNNVLIELVISDTEREQHD